MIDQIKTVFVTGEWMEDELMLPLGIYSTPELARAGLEEQFGAQSWVEQAPSGDGRRHWRGGSYLWVDEVPLDTRL